jgi:hypothetical protein
MLYAKEAYKLRRTCRQLTMFRSPGAGANTATRCSGIMDDHDLVEHVARQFVRRHGACAVELLRERADSSAGDYVSADAWLDIADAAERLLETDTEGE